MDSLEDFISEKIARVLEEKKAKCWNNGQDELLRIRKGKYISFQVPYFITRVSYPDNANRPYNLVVYIHYIEYMINKLVENEKLVIKNYEEYERLYDRVLKMTNQGTECSRFYKNFVKRKNFKEKRLHAQFGGTNE